MNRLARLAAIPLLFLAPSGFSQERIDPEIRRFANIALWAVQESKPKENLSRVIRDFAAKNNVAEATARRLESEVPDILEAFILERAKAWSLGKNVATVNRESTSLKHSTMLIEQSLAFRARLRDSLTAEEMKKWEAFSAKRHAKEAERLQILTETARLKTARRLAENNCRIHIGYLTSGARAFGRFRPLFGQGNDDAVRKQFIAYAKQAVAEAENLTRLEFEQKLIQLKASTEVSDAQSRRLSLAIKGIVSRKYRQKKGELSEVALEKDNAELIKKLTDFGGTLSFETSKADLGFWDKAVSRTLRVEENPKALRGKKAKAPGEQRGMR